MERAAPLDVDVMLLKVQPVMVVALAPDREKRGLVSEVMEVN